MSTVSVNIINGCDFDQRDTFHVIPGENVRETISPEKFWKAIAGVHPDSVEFYAYEEIGTCIANDADLSRVDFK